MGRRGSLLALTLGLAALAAGVAVAVVRHDRSVNARAARLDVESDRYAAVLEQAARTPPRFAVSYVRIALDELDRVTRTYGYRIVPTEITARLRSGRPPLAPNFAELPHPPTLDTVAERLRDGRIETNPEWRDVGALVVSPLTAPQGVSLRLRVDRFAIRGFDGVVDQTDLDGRDAYRRLPTQQHRPAVITWTPRPGTAGELVPLHLLHPFGPSEYGDPLLISGIVLAPHVLEARDSSGRATKVPIAEALGQPVVLAGTPG